MVHNNTLNSMWSTLQSTCSLQKHSTHSVQNYTQPIVDHTKVNAWFTITHSTYSGDHPQTQPGPYHSQPTVDNSASKRAWTAPQSARWQHCTQTSVNHTAIDPQLMTAHPNQCEPRVDPHLMTAHPNQCEPHHSWPTVDNNTLKILSTTPSFNATEA